MWLFHICAFMDYRTILSRSDGLKLSWWIFFSQTCNFSLLKMLIDGLEWIIVMFLSAVWTLILTAPIHFRGSIGEQVMYCNAKFLQTCLNKVINSCTSWMAWGWVHFQQLYSSNCKWRDRAGTHECMILLFLFSQHWIQSRACDTWRPALYLTTLSSLSPPPHIVFFSYRWHAHFNK